MARCEKQPAKSTLTHHRPVVVLLLCLVIAFFPAGSTTSAFICSVYFTKSYAFGANCRSCLELLLGHLSFLSPLCVRGVNGVIQGSEVLALWRLTLSMPRPSDTECTPFSSGMLGHLLSGLSWVQTGELLSDRAVVCFVVWQHFGCFWDQIFGYSWLSQ